LQVKQSLNPFPEQVSQVAWQLTQFPLVSLKVPGGQAQVLVFVFGLIKMTLFPEHVRQFVLEVAQV
jgi:hypothetical protein